MPARTSRSGAGLGLLVAVVALVIAVVFFATSHPIRGIVLVIIGAIAGGYAVLVSRR